MPQDRFAGASLAWRATLAEVRWPDVRVLGLLEALHRAGYGADFALGGMTGSRGPGFAILRRRPHGVHLEIEGTRVRVAVRHGTTTSYAFRRHEDGPSDRLLGVLDGIRRGEPPPA